jgi:hypothetical protein
MDEYQIQPGGTVLCTLSVFVDGQWIRKSDVGGESEQGDEGDRSKAAVSDALKRAAVKWGIGRFLYRLPMQWVEWDAQRRTFRKAPTLPQDIAEPAKAPDTSGKEFAAAMALVGEATGNGFRHLEVAWKALSERQKAQLKPLMPTFKSLATIITNLMNNGRGEEVTRAPADS